MPEMRDISTAPRDGTLIVVHDPDAGTFIMRWNKAGSNMVFQPDPVGIWEASDGSMTWSEVDGCGPSFWWPVPATEPRVTDFVAASFRTVH